MDVSQSNKKRWYKRVWIWVIVVIVLIIAVSASSSKNTPTKVGSGTESSAEQKSEQTTFKPGDVIEFDQKKVTVAAPERSWNSGNQFIVPQSGNEFVKVQVTIENDSNSEATYNTFDWKLQDSSGVIKDVASAAFSVDGALNSGNLAPKGKVSGFLVFEVPAGDAGLTLRYSPSFWLDKKVEIKL